MLLLRSFEGLAPAALAFVGDLVKLAGLGTAAREAVVLLFAVGALLPTVAALLAAVAYPAVGAYRRASALFALGSLSPVHAHGHTAAVSALAALAAVLADRGPPAVFAPVM